ncbi:30S ribosomal protein S16 [candidate division WWE3 bacterium CG_4_9_14_3_um_filter_41_6]|uniref:Small ribosomal subunit protein bS16 n=1 Tax=candidate division WWE3 bacterium CG_4_10_14_0_2_um_filter_41_14 TaxID=1975072 RepID=A0A2M7TLZ2_UNCKA|nr:MAG: 30S ribosomal protein S16 [candidate division WWE3 bacterium CG_4_10_14_0_2_um_filter_41_14]PJA38857.1 MAG: 30S ribosomal protein S16 [candidate division WWE3 bacterium CG_4_9_14_3_um_filter_41_6]
MVKIRLQRTGRTKVPTYRVVVADSKSRRDGRFIEIIGNYSPVGTKHIVIDKQRYAHWIGLGAQPSVTVLRLFKTLGA